MRWLLILNLIILINSESINPESENVRRRKPGFLFTSSKVFTSGENETVCITLHEVQTPTKVLVDLKIKDKHHATSYVLESAYECFEIAVPRFRKFVKDAQVASLHVQIQINGNIHSAHNHEPLLVYPNNHIVFVETDRAIYKPGDRVKIRVLVLNHELKPPQKHQIPIVKIINPSGIVATIWEDVQTELGLIQLEHQLVQDTTPGKWKVELSDVTKSFEVKDYILPRFKVTLSQPRTIYRSVDFVQFSVCAVYSYGKKVKGTATLSLNYLTANHPEITQSVELNYGCARIKFSSHELRLEQFEKSELHILATVSEAETGKKEAASGRSFVTNQPYKLKFIDEKSYFQPGLPYHGKLKAVNSLVPLQNEYVEICYNVAEEHVWNIKEIKQCSNFTFEHDNFIYFYIPPLKNDVLQILLYAKSLNHTSDSRWIDRIYPDSINDNIDAYYAVNRWFSPTNSYIYLEKTSRAHSKCRSAQQFVVYYTTDKIPEETNVTFYYLIKHRDKVLKMRNITHTTRKYRSATMFGDLRNLIGSTHPYIKQSSHIDKFVLKFKLDNKINSKTQLLVYHVLPSGETVAATLDIHVEKCLSNRVETKWSSYQLHPGEKATLEVKTAPDSLCAISAVDKSTSILSNSRTLNVHSLLRRFLQDKPIRKSFKPNCIAHLMMKPTESTTERSEWDLKRKKRFYAMTSQTNQFDSYEAINDAGILVITNLRLIFKPCLYEPSDLSLNYEHGLDEIDFQAQSLTNPYKDLHYDVQNEDSGTSMRSFFPETWLWELVPISSESTMIPREVPHTITNWITNTLCVSQSLGIGLSQPSEISVFQPFFLKVPTPSTIKQGEIMHVEVIIFNYFNYNIPVRTTLGDSEGMEFVTSIEDKTQTMCIPSQESRVAMFKIKGAKLGKLSVTVLAEIDSSYPGTCGPEIIVHKRDIVTKEVLVEPKGFPVYEIKSNFLCIEDSQSDSVNMTWDLNLPNDIVENSLSAKIIINADLLGPSIQNLEKLLNVPTGCGEQIMASLAPNLYILQYLNATDKLTPGNRHRIIRNFKIGYQKILDYLHKDGSFSAFGYHDPSGSMFLTAFVVKVLQQIKQYIYIDQNIINGAVKWILENQLENGCFATVSHVFHDMGGTDTENSTAALTSYVLISLLESQIEISESVSTNAKYCIRGHASSDKYSLALGTYALSLVGWHSEATRSLNRLLQVSSREANLMWWDSASTATNIEMTGYVLMSLLKQNSSSNLVYANSVVRWLTTQRGPQGGFVSTQDTVVALDALTRYAKFASNEEADMEIQLITEYEQHALRLNRNEQLKTKFHNINRLPTKLNVTAKGEGCVLIQAYVNYNLNNLVNSEAFQLAVEVQPVSTTDQCSIAQLSPCLSYKGPGLHSNMAVLEVFMPSGYEPDRASLYKLTEEQGSNVKRFEDKENQVNIYFTELTNSPICVPFTINENSIVETRVEANAKLYDYYNPDLQVTQSYKIHNCQTNKIAAIPNLPTTSKKISNLTYDSFMDFNKTNSIGIDTVDSMINDFSLDSNSVVEKRQTENGLNPTFVNRDYEILIPEGMEGNVPIYTEHKNDTDN